MPLRNGTGRRRLYYRSSGSHCWEIESHWKPARTDSSVAQKAQQALPDPGYAALLKIGPARFDGMVAFSSRIVLTLVSEMLGTLGDEWPASRDLTPAELSLIELLFGEIARAFSQGWPEVEALPVEMDQILVRPLRSRIFQPRENLIRSIVGDPDACWRRSICHPDATVRAGFHRN